MGFLMRLSQSQLLLLPLLDLIENRGEYPDSDFLHLLIQHGLGP